MTNTLSLFDGISCLQLALHRAGCDIGTYYASEINKHSIKVTQTNFPNTVQLGDVNNISFRDLNNIGFIGAGSPCQDISGLNRSAKGLKGKKSSLFYKFLEAKEAFPEADYLLENVSGTDSSLITRELKRKPLKLDSNIIVPQNRNRLYWTNIPVNSMPKKSTATLQDILQTNVDDKYYQSEGWLKWWNKKKVLQLKKGHSKINPVRATCLITRMYANYQGTFIQDDKGIRRLTPVECERLQTLPDGYTSSISDKWAYHSLGDCWTVDIIVHILKHRHLVSKTPS